MIVQQPMAACFIAKRMKPPLDSLKAKYFRPSCEQRNQREEWRNKRLGETRSLNSRIHLSGL